MNKALKMTLRRSPLVTDPRLDTDTDAEAKAELPDDELEYGLQLRLCGVCGGDGESLGVLGTLHHFRCRQCGAQFAQSVDLP